jgi:hypothetical protein
MARDKRIKKIPNSPWPLMSEVVGRENVNKKTPNNLTNANEKMPNNHDDSVIYYERVLSEIAKKRNQINFDSEAGRKAIAEEIAKQKMPNNSTETANSLIDQLIIAAAQDDEHLKDYWIGKGQGERAIGESFVVFHLKALKKLLNE